MGEMHIPRGRRHCVNEKNLFWFFFSFFFMFVFLFALWCFSLHHVCVLVMHTSLYYCASLNACSDDHLLCYVIIVVISLWLFWCMIKLIHMFHIMFTWSQFTCYIILVLLLLALPWRSNVFCASISGYKYICFKFITTPMIHDRGSDMIRGEREKELCVILTMFLLCS